MYTAIQVECMFYINSHPGLTLNVCRYNLTSLLCLIMSQRPWAS